MGEWVKGRVKEGKIGRWQTIEQKGKHCMIKQTVFEVGEVEARQRGQRDNERSKQEVLNIRLFDLLVFGHLWAQWNVRLLNLEWLGGLKECDRGKDGRVMDGVHLRTSSSEMKHLLPCQERLGINFLKREWASRLNERLSRLPRLTSEWGKIGWSQSDLVLSAWRCLEAYQRSSQTAPKGPRP